MFLPPEILLSVLEALKNDRDTLHKLRLVDKYFCQLATDTLFGNFSVHYGFKHSVPQMKAIIKSPGLQPYIRSLHLPSESFFPIAKNFTLRVGGGYRFAWSRDLSKTVEPPARRNCYEQQTDSSSYRGYMEVPTNKNARFNLAIKRYQKEYETYTKTLTDFLEKCVNLRTIHITTGLGFDAERSDAWCLMINSKVLHILAKLPVRRIEISVASYTCLSTMLRGYNCDPSVRSDGLPEFPSVTSVSIKGHHEMFYRRFPFLGERDSEINNQLSGFLAAMPNLASYSVANTELRQRSVELLPTRCTYNGITSLSLSHIFLDQRILEVFKAVLSDMPSVTTLSLDSIVLSLSARRELDIQREQRLPKGMSPTPPRDLRDLQNPFASQYVPFADQSNPFADPSSLFGGSSLFGNTGNAGTSSTPSTFGQGYTSPLFDFDMFIPSIPQREIEVPAYKLMELSLGTTWSSVFDLIQKRLPKLTDFFFQRLFYTDANIVTGRDMLLYIPVQDREDYNRRDFEKFARGTRDMELVSTFETDYLALESFRNTVNERRQKFGLVEIKSYSKSVGFGGSGSEDGSHRLNDEIVGFEHQTKDGRIIIVPHHNLWGNDDLDRINQLTRIDHLMHYRPLDPWNIYATNGDLTYWRA
ncbi:hypothetical protein TWF718_002288 [Orbilia javanica]|uniref:F-box domain-containing protein n=1 Tax=Orbilia javanica TaxID=47235 RepID=A0AAN8MTY7_9PEZI